MDERPKGFKASKKPTVIESDSQGGRSTTLHLKKTQEKTVQKNKSSSSFKNTSKKGLHKTFGKSARSSDSHLATVLSISAEILGNVCNHADLGTELDNKFNTPDDKQQAPAARAGVLSVCYGAMREWGSITAIIKKLSRHPVTDVTLLGLLGAAVYRLRSRPAAAYATVDQAVMAAKKLKLPHGLVNAVLRSYLRQKDNLEEMVRASKDDETRWNFPTWWLKKLQDAYPNQWEAIVEASNAPPPMTLRVNTQHKSVENYLQCLAEAQIDALKLTKSAILLKTPVPVDMLPGFDKGWVSVQDESAQMAAFLLDAKSGDRVLDVCAAPGGKTGHILEIANVNMTALDIDSKRLQKVKDNLVRLGFFGNENITLLAANGEEPGSWWDGNQFDKILVDAPCTGSGVVRRHADSKWSRSMADITIATQRQAQLLRAVWPLLKSGGRLLYATCSVFPEENEGTVDGFLKEEPTAKRILIEGKPFIQRLPTEKHDGFFYALLERKAKN